MPIHLLLEQLEERVHRERLRTLDRKTQDTVEHELRQRTNSTRDTEKHRVELELVEAVRVEHTARRSIHVRVRVLGLAMLLEHNRSKLRKALHELHNRGLLELLTGLAELAQGNETRVGLAEHSVTVARHDAAALKGGPELVNDLLVGRVLANLALELEGPVEHLLVSETVERASETVETSRVREVRVRQGAADKVCGVGRNVTTLVVGVHGHVETEVVGETLRATEAELVREVLDQVHLRVDLLCSIALAVNVVVNTGSHRRELGDEVQRVLKRRDPVLGLLNTLRVGSSELAVVVQSSRGDRELSHRVQRLRERVDDLDEVLGQLSTGNKVARETLDLLHSRSLAGQQEPEHRLRKHLATWATNVRGLREDLGALRNAQAVESNTSLGVKNRALPEHALEATHATKDVAHLAVTELGLSVLSLELGDLLALGWNNLSHSVLQRLGRRKADRRGRSCSKLTRNNSRTESSTVDRKGQHGSYCGKGPRCGGSTGFLFVPRACPPFRPSTAHAPSMQARYAWPSKNRISPVNCCHVATHGRSTDLLF